MGKQIITSGAALLIALTGSAWNTGVAAAAQSTPVIVTGEAAGGHENIDALKAELAALKTELANTQTGRQFLTTRLEEVLAESKEKDASAAAMQAENTDLLKSLRFMTDNRDYLVDEMSMGKEKTAAELEALESSLSKAKKGRKFLSDKYLESRAALKSQQSESAAAMGDLEKENARMSLALERALRGKAYLRSRLDDTEKELAKDSLALERATRGKAYLRGRLDDTEKQLAKDSLALERATRGKAYLRSRLDDTEAELAKDSLALERATRGKAYLRGRLDEAEKHLSRDSLALERALRGKAYLRGKLDDMNAEMDQLAAVSFAQIESAVAERDAAIGNAVDTDWADALSANLTESFGTQSSTEVTALSNNSVAIKVGNTGLFRPGSTTLSAGGEALLNEIGQELISRDDAQIRLIGHSDNIPTGSGSRYASNNELSLARATSALSYLSSIGVPADRLAASGVGEAYPIASNDTEEGRLANRRVEIVLTPAR